MKKAFEMDFRRILLKGLEEGISEGMSRVFKELGLSKVFRWTSFPKGVSPRVNLQKE